MSRRHFRILASLGVSMFFVFLLTSTSLPATAHTISSRSHVIAHITLNKFRPSVTPFTVSTNVHCQADILTTNWIPTGNGPAGFGCGGNAWESTTPTNGSAMYKMGIINGPARYHLNAFITNHANAPMDYIINAFPSRQIAKCFYDQSTGIAWKTVCSFTVISADIDSDLEIVEQSGAVHSFTMSSSAIQLLPY